MTERLVRDEGSSPAMTLAHAPQNTRSEAVGRSHNPPQRSQYFNSIWIGSKPSSSIYPPLEK